MAAMEEPVARNSRPTSPQHGEAESRYGQATPRRGKPGEETAGRRLGKQILGIYEEEQRYIGRELHDNLGQQLTGIAIISKVLEQRLQRQSLPEATNAKEIARLVNEAIDQVRQLSRRLHPVSQGDDGLASALQALATATQNSHGVTCAFACAGHVPVQDLAIATHVYRIAQEAVANAICHGDARQVSLALSADHGRATLTIENDGRDFPAKVPDGPGVGLQIMYCRAEAIGGTLDVQRRAEGGTRVICTFTTEPQSDAKEKHHVREDTP
jgi:two-component system sensor kinase FixL